MFVRVSTCTCVCDDFRIFFFIFAMSSVVQSLAVGEERVVSNDDRARSWSVMQIPPCIVAYYRIFVPDISSVF